MRAKVIEFNGRFYMSISDVIQYKYDESGNRIKD